MKSKRNTFRFLCLIAGLVIFSSCPNSGGGGGGGSSARGSSSKTKNPAGVIITPPGVDQIVGNYKSNDNSNKIAITKGKFTYERTFSGYEGNFTFLIDEDSDWKVTNHPLKKAFYYVVVVEGEMSDCSGYSPNSNLILGAKTLTFIVRMQNLNGKQTDTVIEMLLPTDDWDKETAYIKV